MLKQYKNDIKTIVEVLAFIAVSLSWGMFFTQYQWITISWAILVIGGFSYRYYILKVNKTDIITFPTVNDGYSKMTFITFSILILIFSVIGYYAFDLKIYYSVIGLSIGIAVFFLGYFKPPLGWLLIKNNALNVYGVQEEIDSRQLRDILLKDDQIILTDVYGDIKKSTMLSLSPLIAENIKRYIDEKLKNTGVIVVNSVQ